MESHSKFLLFYPTHMYMYPCPALHCLAPLQRSQISQVQLEQSQPDHRKEVSSTRVEVMLSGPTIALALLVASGLGLAALETSRVRIDKNTFETSFDGWQVENGSLIRQNVATLMTKNSNISRPIDPMSTV